MFSYRHAFHAGNHADVLKHGALIAMLRRMAEKEAAVMVVDTHAGAGLYRLDTGYATVSGESASGIARLWAARQRGDKLAPLLHDYVDLIAAMNDGIEKGGGPTHYPGSPFVAFQLMRGHDALRLFELHPSDLPALIGNVGQLNAERQIQVIGENGFEGFKKFLPPPSRRALVLMDPSYEDKRDYSRVVASCAEALQRMATATICVWYPVLPRLDSQGLPGGLKRIATQHNAAAKGSKVGWLHAILRVGADGKEGEERRGLVASGLFVFNPPFGLKDELQASLPQMVKLLGTDRKAEFSLTSGGR